MKVLVCQKAPLRSTQGTPVQVQRKITEQHDTPQQAMIGYVQKTEGLHKHQTKICAVQSGWQDWQKCKKDIVKAQEGSSVLNSP